jgi:DNA repair protein RadC
VSHSLSKSPNQTALSEKLSEACASVEKPHYIGHRQRLKERFLKDEGQSMPDYELLELLLTAGILRRDVKELAKSLLSRFGSLAKVINAPTEALEACNVPMSAIVYLKVVLATARKTLWQSLRETDVPVFTNFDMLTDYCRSVMSHLPIEEFHVIFLDAGLRLIEDKVMQKGTVTSVSVHPREVVKEALLSGATSVVLMHNHPGGHCSPSANDRAVTRAIEEALTPLGITVYDHLIFTDEDYFSFHDHNLLMKK